jgi:branched-chain amino acid transport system substrate-binding protein
MQRTTYIVRCIKDPPFLSRTLILLSALTLTLFGCSDEPYIELGFVAGLSGRVADLGIAGRNGATLAVEEWNQRGGVSGRQIKLVVRDDAQKPEIARHAVQELIDRRVSAIIGHMTSSMTMSTVDMVNTAKIVMMSPTSTTDDLVGMDDYFFRVLAPTRQYAERNAEYLFKELGHRAIAVAYDINNRAYTVNWFKNFQRRFETLGGRIVTEWPFPSSADVHFSELAQKLLTSKPDGVLIITNAMDAALLSQQIRKSDPGIGISTSEWAATEQLIDLGGPAVDGVLITQFFDRFNADPNYLRFRERYKQRFGAEPGFPSVAGYDATNTVLHALDRAKGRSLRETLLAIKTFPGAQDEVQLDQFGDAQRRSYLTRVVNGQFMVIGE